jgi:two-component system nitrate/nitrite response regulator NarL
MIRLAVFTPEPLLSIAVSTVIASQQGDADIHLSGIAATASDLAAQIASETIDVLLLSTSAGVDWGVLHAIRRESPATKVVLWTDDASPEMAFHAMEAGVRGILRRSATPELVLKCVRKVYAGELWLEKSLADTFLHGRAVKLSRREGDLVRLLAQGLKNKEIASVLGITEGTVKVYLSKLFVKVGAKDRFELALFGLKHVQSGSNGAQFARSPRTLFFGAGAGRSRGDGPGAYDA